MNEVGVAVIVPEGAGVDPALGVLDAGKGGPGAGGVLGGGHEDAEIGVAEVDVKPAVVEADGRRPHAGTVGGGVEVGVEGRGVAREGVGDDRPMHEIAGVQDGQAGEAGEGRSGHIEVIAGPAHIGVGIVGEDDGVFVRTRAVIGGVDRRGARR